MISEKDLKIINSLRVDARQPLTRMSRKINIPVSTIHDRIKHHDKSLIKKHTALLDFGKLGFTAWIKVMLKVDREDRDKLKEFLKRHPQVNSLFKINNGYDFMVEALFRSFKDAEHFLEKLETDYNIKEKVSYYVVDDLRREDFMIDEFDIGA